MIMSNGPGPAPPTPNRNSVITMFMIMGLMLLLVMNPGLRTSLGEMAQPILSPVLPEEKYFILTVLILGSASMLVNTVLRNMFMDPIAQAHLQHRQREVRQIMNEARMNRDSSLQDKAMTLQQQMMPEQMDLQTGMMKPMMFTMVFIIGIFAWLTTSVENFRVDYVSLPWTPEWNLLDDRFLFFPAWICAYICMSAPLGRVVDRHMKLIRYKSHPLVLDGGRISEPLLHLVQTKKPEKKKKNRANNNRRNQAKASKNTSKQTQEEDTETRSDSTMVCPECGSESVSRDGPSLMRCDVCLHSWK
ncbi:MAG: hypothetical protein CMB73_01770 [Euryarchaeota archaeon]|nr:hypothetical protein [Euryarchaeota archaeon]